MRPLLTLRAIGDRIGEGPSPALPEREVDAVLTLLARRYGSLADPDVLVPEPDLDALGALVAGTAPHLAALAAELPAAVEGPWSAVILPRLGLDRLSPAERCFLLFALSLGIGRPTATDHLTRRIVWNLRACEDRMARGTASTFSEHNEAAPLHTDTQYYAEPERYLLQYFVRSAGCGGGTTELRDGASVVRALERSDAGRRALAVLTRTPLPFRIPAAFTRDGAASTLELTWAPIFGARPALRFRVDTLEAGLAACPEHATPEVRDALRTLYAELADPCPRVERTLEPDTLVLINNHEALHGRTAFTDLARHAVRIRIAEGP
ncbi:MAG: TauD/TfdA family dioxygenase [Deltaproteobacteria bacterium]|nr:TauD/TfdA family dioxygenase [Deltaproteobacteria bacterium]